MPRLIDPADGLSNGGSKRADSVVADGLHVEDLDPSRLVLPPESMVERLRGLGGGDWRAMGRRGRVGVEEGGFADGDDMGDACERRARSVRVEG